MSCYTIVGICSLIAVALHEAAHYSMARFVGVRTYGVRLSWKGIGIVRQNVIEPHQAMAITMAGPLINLLLAGSVFLTPWFRMWAIWFSLTNFVTAVICLLPIGSINDGAKLLSLVRSRK